MLAGPAPSTGGLVFTTPFNSMVNQHHHGQVKLLLEESHSHYGHN